MPEETTPAPLTNGTETKPADQEPNNETKPADQEPNNETKPADQEPNNETKPADQGQTIRSKYDLIPREEMDYLEQQFKLRQLELEVRFLFLCAFF